MILVKFNTLIRQPKKKRGFSVSDKIFYKLSCIFSWYELWKKVFST